MLPLSEFFRCTLTAALVRRAGAVDARSGTSHVKLRPYSRNHALKAGAYFDIVTASTDTVEAKQACLVCERRAYAVADRTAVLQLPPAPKLSAAERARE